SSRCETARGSRRNPDPAAARRGYAALGEIEPGGVVADFLRRAVRHFIQAHGLHEREPAMKKLHPKLAPGAGPERALGAVANGLIAVPVESGERLRQRTRRRLEGFLRQRPRLSFEPRVVEWLRGGRRAPRAARKPGRPGAGQRGRAGFEKFSPLHGSKSHAIERPRARRPAPDLNGPARLIFPAAFPPTTCRRSRSSAADRDSAGRRDPAAGLFSRADRFWRFRR